MSGAVAEAALGETIERKLDPEALAIRARPIRAIRFKRGLIVGLAGAAAIVLVVIAWFALKPHVFRVVAQPDAVAEPETRPPVDALGTLPKTYGDVPRLGPPLPGDLGKPILEQQQASAFAAEGGGNVAAQAAQAERANAGPPS